MSSITARLAWAAAEPDSFSRRPATCCAARPGEDGRFFFQFILDDGAEEFVLEPSVSAGRLLLSMIEDAQTLFLDAERGRLMLRKLD